MDINFRHNTGYNRSRIRLSTSDQSAVNWHIALYKVEGHVLVVDQSYNTQSVVDQIIPGLEYSTTYGLVYTIDGGDPVHYDESGLRLETLKRWHFARQLFYDGELIEKLRAAMLSVIEPNTAVAILDALEAICKVDHIAEEQVDINEDQDDLDIIET